MNRFMQALALRLSLSLASVALAHEGHEHAQPLDQAKAVETASTKMLELINTGELDGKWATRTPSGAQLARINGQQNWIVSYLDEAASERLELVFTMTGEYVSLSRLPVSAEASAR